MNRILIFLFLLMVLVWPTMSFGQCAMCKAVVESNAQSGDNVVAGVNNAVMYLMGIPYLLVGIGAMVWYKKYYKSETEN